MLKTCLAAGRPRPDFQYFSREIARRWKHTSAQDKAYYDQLAVVGKRKYVAKLIKWQAEQERLVQCVDTATAVKQGRPALSKDKYACEQDTFKTAASDSHVRPDRVETFGMDYTPIDLAPIPFRTDPIPVSFVSQRQQRERMWPADCWTRNEQWNNNDNSSLLQWEDNDDDCETTPGSPGWIASRLGPEGIRTFLTLLSDN